MIHIKNLVHESLLRTLFFTVNRIPLIVFFVVLYFLTCQGKFNFFLAVYFVLSGTNSFACSPKLLSCRGNIEGNRMGFDHHFPSLQFLPKKAVVFLI